MNTPPSLVRIHGVSSKTKIAQTLVSQLSHPHPDPPLEREGEFLCGRSVLIRIKFDKYSLLLD
jgi:hypothetical protein